MIDRGRLGSAMIVASLAAVAVIACSSPEEFQGTNLNPARAAAPFELVNQFGNRVRLSDRNDRVVVLTFLYTSCPDICPLTTSHLRDTLEHLDRDADEVAFIAVSVDPERDSIESAHAYSEQWGMTQRWDFLVGGREQLSPIWESYYIASEALESTGEDGPSAHETTSARAGSVDALGRKIERDYLVGHSAPVYLIDREGMMRSVFTLPFEPEDLAHDIRLLVDM